MSVEFHLSMCSCSFQIFKPIPDLPSPLKEVVNGLLPRSGKIKDQISLDKALALLENSGNYRFKNKPMGFKYVACFHSVWMSVSQWCLYILLIVISASLAGIDVRLSAPEVGVIPLFY